MTAEVVVAFRDIHTWHLYAPGDVYEGSDTRVGELRSLGIVAGDQAGGDAPDYQSMTNAQLSESCAKMGIVPPKRATKAQLIALLDD